MEKIAETTAIKEGSSELFTTTEFWLLVLPIRRWINKLLILY
jgi:hypothetical protein